MLLVLAALATTAFFASVQFFVPEPIDFDVYYHLALAREMRANGPLQAFPWTPYSIFSVHFADKEFLFHALLMAVSDLPVTLAAQWGAVAGQAFLAGVFAFTLWKLRVPYGWFFVALLMTQGDSLAIRLAMCRPHTWGVAFSVLVLWMLIARVRLRWLALAVYFYGMFHTASWISVAYAGIWGFWCFVFPPEGERRRIVWQPLAACAAGWFAGQVLHPNFPETFRLFYLQNFVVPFHTTAAGNDALKVALGGELYTAGIKTVISHLPMILLFAAALAVIFSRWRRPRPEVLLVLTVALAFGIVSTFFLKRLYEIAAPLTVFAFAVVWKFVRCADTDDTDGDESDADGEETSGGASPAVQIAGMIILAAGALYTGLAVRERVSPVSPSLRMAKWVGRNVVEPQKIFTAQWADSAPLLYFAPHLTTMVALDPTFFYARDRELFIEYVDIVLGRTKDPVPKILDRFDSKWVTMWKIPAFRRFAMQLSKDPRAKLAYDDKTYQVWKLSREPQRTLPPPNEE